MANLLMINTLCKNTITCSGYRLNSQDITPTLLLITRAIVSLKRLCPACIQQRSSRKHPPSGCDECSTLLLVFCSLKTFHLVSLYRFRLIVTSVVVVIFAVLWRYQESHNVRLVTDYVTGQFSSIRDRVTSLGIPLQNLVKKIYNREKT